MKTKLFLLLLLSATTSLKIVCSQDEAGPTINVQEVARAGAWTISTLKTKGKPLYAMMSRSYQDGRMFRYFFGKKVSSLMIYDPAATQAMAGSSGLVPGSIWFSGAGGETPPVKVNVSWSNELTNEQDAVVTVDVASIEDFLAAIVEEGAVNLKFKGYSGKFDMRGAQNAADQLLNHARTAAEPAAKAESEAEPEGEKIVLQPSDTSVVWDLSLPGGQSKVYQISGRKGQKIEIVYIEDTGKGQVDVGKASVEEGQQGFMIEFERDRLQRIDVTNPSNRKMEFRIALSVR